MTCDELDSIRMRWHPDADVTRPRQDCEDVRDLVNEIDAVSAQHVAMAMLLSEIAECDVPLPRGFQARAKELLGRQGMPCVAPTT